MVRGRLRILNVNLTRWTVANPFEPWLPMYREGTVDDRPMWREVEISLGRAFYRIDGEYVEVLSHNKCGPILDIFDAANPVPAPPPMCGQVWTDAAGSFSIADVSEHGAVVTRHRRMDTGETLDGHALVTVSNAPYVLSEWPPTNAVLVAGPTPGGRDMPWYPAGWKA